MKTNIKLVMTEITFYEPETKEVGIKKVSGKKTVKECKDLMYGDDIYISKKLVTEEFEVLTEELLKIKIEKGVVENEI